jgi:mono/diheme cytochrome c family protein
MFLKALLALMLVPLMSCGREMGDQPLYDGFEKNEFFADGRSIRPPVKGTKEYRASAAPVPAYEVDADFLGYGQSRYETYCSVCHDRAGTGRGMIVQRGFTRPPSLLGAEARGRSDRELYAIIGQGFGRMPSYAAQFSDRDRWAVVAYLRTLQLAASTPRADLNDQDLQALQGEKK